MLTPPLRLIDLIAPLSLDSFFKLHWPAKPLFQPAIANKLEFLHSLPQLQSLEKLLDERVLPVRACLPDFNDEVSSIFVNAQDAIKAYRNSMTLVFDGMHTQSSFLQESLNAVQRDLGLPTGGESNLTNARVMAYATPAGGTTRLHFDANANFVIQLAGTKRWRILPNDSVKHPTDRYTSGTGEISIALERQCEAMLLDELPENYIECVMKPGSVLFVPRGYWHETLAEEDSLSLNFTFGQPTWADILTLTLREHLHQSAAWRELADGVESDDPTRRTAAVAHLQNRMKILSKEWAAISAEQLLTEAGFKPAS